MQLSATYILLELNKISQNVHAKVYSVPKQQNSLKAIFKTQHNPCKDYKQ